MSRKTTRSGARGGGAEALPAMAGAGTGAGSPPANAQSQSRLAAAASPARFRLSHVLGVSLCEAESTNFVPQTRDRERRDGEEEGRDARRAGGAQS